MVESVGCPAAVAPVETAWAGEESARGGAGWIRWEKVARVRVALAGGRYRVSADVLAEALLREAVAVG